LGLDGDPHITTINGIHYNFQGAGEFVSLREPDGLEIQVRQAPIATTFNPGPDAHDGLATCVSLNTAVAARVAKHRVTYEPNLNGVPDPRGLQLRVDGAPVTLGPSGLDLGDGGRLVNTAAPGGVEIDFPDGTVLNVTPGWWASQSKWYLNVDVVRSATIDGITGAPPGSSPTPGTGGIAAAIVPGSWLPALPDGSSMGPMPGSLNQRYVDLYQKFGEAWRVTDKTTLFDYAAGTSTDTFTVRNWPPENPPCVIPDSRPARPLDQRIAQEVCRPIVDKNRNADCVFDVTVTGERGFAKTYLLSQRIELGSTRTTVSDNKDPTGTEEPVMFTAIVMRNTAAARRESDGEGGPTGTVQFILDGEKAGGPITLDSRGLARWKASYLKVGTHKVAAQYTPANGSVFLASSSLERSHTVREEGR
jgi:hypothetical protein